jgi:hypothetical protein
VIHNDRRLQLIIELRELTERQVIAARTLDNETMQHLNELRSDHLFNLQVALQDTPPQDPELKRVLVAETRALQSAEERLIRITELVLQTFEQMTPFTPAKTYGASGRLSG